MVYSPPPVSAASRARGVVLADVHDLLRGDVRRQVGVGGQLPVQQVGDRVFLRMELQPIPGAVVAGHIPVANDVLAVHDGLDQPLVARLVYLLEVGQDEVVSIPVKKRRTASQRSFGSVVEG